MATASNSSDGRSARSRAARVVAPLALIACSVAVYFVIADTQPEATPDRTDAKARSGQVNAQRPDNPKTYVIQLGDSLSAIAETTGVSAAKIERLNPSIDATTLNPGQTLKLR